MFNVCTTVVLLVFLDGLFPCVFPSLVMCVGGVGCHPGAVLSGVFLWVVSGCECCVLVLEVCVCKLCLEREKMKERADPVCLLCALLWCCLCSWMVCFRVCFHLL